MTRCIIRILLTVTMILSCVSVSIGQLSWDTKKISIQSKNKSLRYVLEEINQKLNVGFIFDDKLINKKTVTRDVKNKTVEEILKLILPDAGLDFREVQDRRIVLYQPPPQDLRSKVVGRITDTSTGEPLYFVNVFLSGTTLGSATDKDGHYSIDNIPPGPYDLVATMMGFEPQKASIKLFDEKEMIVHFKLKPKVLKGKTISITGEIPKEWKRNLKIFERVFFGPKEFAKKCKFQNPEVLDFEYDRSSGQFQAFAEAPVIFENKALGYEVTFLMDNFYAELIDDDIYGFVKGDETIQEYRQGRFRLFGLAKFKELLPKNKNEKKKWRKNRLIAYNGSRRHFFRSLCEERIKEERFEIYITTDYMGKWDRKIKVDTILKMGTNSYERILAFPNLLKVIYKKEKDKIQYEQGLKQLNSKPNMPSHTYDFTLFRLERRCATQKSFIKINGDNVTLSTNGLIISNGDNMEFSGYWSWDRADEWLPTDYEPPKKE